MKKASFVISNTFYQNNRLFNLSDTTANRDNCLYPFALLKEQMANLGYDLATSDINPPNLSDIVLYNEMPKTLPTKDQKQKSYLLIFESELIRPDNWELDRHQAFNKVFTWHDDFVGLDNYSKINFSFQIPSTISKDISKKQKLCTLIAGNKKICHPLELYSKRVEAIKWFEQHHIEDFEFFGIGWDEYKLQNKYINFVFKKTKLSKLFKPDFPSYQGKVDSKKEVLERFKFAICYENARDIPGYITEKIFDCLFAGCVPVYWGANNIEDYVSKDCFVDAREFSSYDSMYNYLISMSDEEYLHRLDSIESYIQSGQIQQFSANTFVQSILSEILRR